MKSPHAISDNTEELQTCPRCGSTELDTAMREVEFDYGGREKPFRVKAAFPFKTCRTCCFSFLDGDDEELQHNAACRHLGVMTPAEIRALREKTGLSQKEFAELTGLGVASISRWERGLLIQNEACDQLLYLLTFPENLERLRRRKTSSEEGSSGPVHAKSEQSDGSHFSSSPILVDRIPWKRVGVESYAAQDLRFSLHWN